MTGCLSNAVVVRKIFQLFSNRQLLKLSRVNKLWNYEARSLMKNRCNLIVRLMFRDYQPCQWYLNAFAADLLRMNVVPFSGIRIKLAHCSRACRSRALDSIYKTILDKLPLKSVSVDLNGEWCENQYCPGSLLARQVLQHFSGVLEEVSISKFWSEDDNLIVGLLVGSCSFPSLKILKLREDYGARGTHLASTLKTLVAGAPNLQELHTLGPINLMLGVLEGRSAVFVNQSYVSAPFNEIPDNFITAIRLEAMKLHYTGPDFNVERFNRIAPMLLQSSCIATLDSMELDAILAVPLMCYGIRLEKVRHLTMYMNPGQLELDELRILKILKDFDFTRIFPNLKIVLIFPPFDHLELSPDHMDGFVEQANASLKEPKPDRAINIKELDLLASITSDAEFYAEMFPHVERLHMREEDEKIPFGSIWKNWVNLKQLIVKVDVQQHYEDLESATCGIFPEEVAELRLKDEELLKKVNIVPVMPAITCLRNLRKFMLVLAPPSDRTFAFPSPRYIQHPSSCMILSKVTGLVAFERCPKLTVALSAYDSHVYEALKHMKPYASVYNVMSAAAE